MGVAAGVWDGGGGWAGGGVSVGGWWEAIGRGLYMTFENFSAAYTGLVKKVGLVVRPPAQQKHSKNAACSTLGRGACAHQVCRSCAGGQAKWRFRRIGRTSSYGGF